MKLNKSNYMKLCEAAWDLSHDGTDKQVFAHYSPHVGKLNLELFLDGWEANKLPDTVYELYETIASTFSQSCDPDDIAESLQMMIKEGEE